MLLSQMDTSDGGRAQAMKLAIAGGAKVHRGKVRAPVVSAEFEGLLLEALAPRWDGASRMLNLTALALDPVFAAKPISGGFNNIGFCTALVSVIQANCGSCAGIDLSSNGIGNLQVR